MSDSRSVAVLMGNGTITTQTAPVPELGAGMVQIAVKASVVSPGTEVGGWDTLADQLAKGLPAQEPRTFGYSAAGEVTGVGDGVDDLVVGQRVAAVGAGYALHTDVAVVPHHLCIPIPDGVVDADAAYAMLLATALHATRRATPTIGEYWLVMGLGIVGLLTARLLQLSGCFVAGSDQHAYRCSLAGEWMGDTHVVATDPDAMTKFRAATNNEGFDGAVVAFGGAADTAMDTAVDLMKISPDGHPYGTIVTVGWPTFSYSGKIGAMNNIDLRRASRTGPGYHDDVWERGPDYPPVFMRWTTRSNLRLCMELLRRGRIDVSKLTTHTIPLASVGTRIPEILAKPSEILGVVFTSA